METTKKKTTGRHRDNVRCYVQRLGERNIKIYVLDLDARKALIINTTPWGFPSTTKEYGTAENPTKPGRHLGRRVPAGKLLAMHRRTFEELGKSGKLTPAMREEFASSALLLLFSSQPPCCDES